MNTMIRLWKLSVKGLPRRGFLPPDADIRPTLSIVVPASTATHDIKVNIFYPPGKVPGSGHSGKLPVHLNVHGCGFCFDVFPTEAEFAAQIALRAGCIVVDTDYSKSPAHPFPAGYNDVQDVVAYILSRGDDWDLSRFTIGGCSSGGCLALAVAAHRPKGIIKGTITFYPLVDVSLLQSEESILVPAIPPGNPGHPLNLFERSRFQEAYTLGQDVDLKDPRMSPLHAPADAFPPVTIMTGDRDPLLPGILKLVEKLRTAGNDVETMIVDGAGHGWERMVRPGDEKFEKLREEALQFHASRLQECWTV